MSELDNPEYNSEIEKVLLEKLNKEGTFKEGINLLNELTGLSGMQINAIKSMIRKELKNYDKDDEFKENIENALKKLKKK